MLRVSGSEQDDMMYTLYYSGDSRSEKAGSWFTDEEVVELIQSTYGDDVEESSKTDTEKGAETNETTGDVSRETIDFYMSLDPACSFHAENEMEYRLIAVDRACGSSYYALVGTCDNGKTCSFVNTDPYNGAGGEAKWITFVSESIGFSCLARSGGSFGYLYRTEDGGKSFVTIEYPSPKFQLPDGTYYNPFVMPEKIYEENGKIYMEVGQGPDGDYYDEQGYCHGLYQSSDDGLNWEFVQKMYIER